MAKSRKGEQPAARSPREITDEMLAVIPIRPENVEAREDSQGMLHLRVTMEQKGLTGRIAKWLRYDYSRTYELDEFGTFFYRQVDGKASLKTIIRRMVKQFDKPYKEVEYAVVLFTKTLMMKNMLVLEMPTSQD
ncbi:MAG TPA: PqqD family peptide modification chaperone [Armatimonadota bacterium]|nr:PqqD family peptide modification chaperone [Armatimonadota bacterium]